MQNLGNRMYGHRCHTAIVQRHFSEHNIDDMRVMVIHKLKNSSSTIYRRGVEYFYLLTLNPTLNVDLAPP